MHREAENPSSTHAESMHREAEGCSASLCIAHEKKLEIRSI
jgi:hypothetical protein